MAEQDDQMIAQMAAQQLGAPAPDAAPAQPQEDPAKQDNPPTNQEKIQEAASPETEGDKQKEESFIEVDFGDGRKEVMSASQIAGMTSRYKDLNHKNATRYKPLEPAIDVLNQLVDQARANGADVSGDDVAQFVAAAIQGMTKNPTMGGQQDTTPDRPDGQPGNPDLDAQMEQEIEAWERENAVSLPPMYRQGFKVIRNLMQENEVLRNNMGGLLQQAQQLNSDAQQQLGNAQTSGEMVYRQQAANNLNEAQQTMNLPDELEDDFFNFAYGRGYTVEDFIDRELTFKVMQDFNANRQTPEMERLRALNAKRQAFTGAASATPSAGGNPVQPSADQDFMNAVAQKAMQKRGLI
jgi:hypothetical protein